MKFAKLLILKKIIIDVLCIAIMLFLFFSITHNCEASYQEREKISHLDFRRIGDIKLLNDILYQDNLLNYFKVRERLLLMPYEQLNMLKKKTSKLGFKNLNSVIDNTIFKMEKDNIFFLTEDIFVDNVPSSKESPFYKDSVFPLKITDIKPHAEYLYFYNLKLKYRKNTLLKETEEHWINPKENIKERENILPKSDINSFPHQLLANEVKQIWSYELRYDNLTNFFNRRDTRQWIKRYEENPIFLVTYKGAVIIRNEHRLFCIDLLSGKEIWSVGDIDKNSQEFWQNFRHPHINSYGYEFLLVNDTIFTELSGKLVAFDIRDNLSPKLIWKSDLGEYAVCTKPILAHDTLIVGLINARGELWFCGFNVHNGSLMWNTYIGTSSYLSPACGISVVSQDRVFIATNHGVLVCLNPYNGNIIWIRKYNPKKYSLLDYWQKGYFRSTFLETGSIQYDTQFIDLAEDGFLYYKPRESDYLYILDSRSGQLKEKILIDSDRYYILKIIDGKAIFLAKADSSLENSELKIVDLNSGKTTYNLFINKGILQGISYIDNNKIIFKIDDKIHFLKVNYNDVVHRQVYVPFSGWLLGYEANFLFIGKDRFLFCLDLFNQTHAYSQIKSSFIEYLLKREKIKEMLSEALQSDMEDERITKIKEELLSNLSIFRFCFDQIFPLIVKNIDKLKHPKWKDFIENMQKLYADEVVTYNDIEMRFSNFLYGAGLINNHDKEERKNIFKNKKYPSNYQFRADTLFLLPIEVIKGPSSLEFFLLTNNNQLLCVAETGEILWSSKIFYNLAEYGKSVLDRTDTHRGRMYADEVKAYLYNNTLIINDRVNIIALDVRDGTYIWSMTNKGSKFIEERQYPPIIERKNEFFYTIFRIYGINFSFIKNIMFNTKFVDDALIITHGNKIYSVDPNTGFCRYYSQLDCELFQDIISLDGNIYLLTYSPDTLKILNKELLILKDSPLDFIAEKGIRKLLFFKDHIVIHVKNNKVSILYVLDKDEHKIRYKVDLSNNFNSQSDLYRHYLEVFKDKLLLIIPFQKIVGYYFDKESFIVNQIFNAQPTAENVFWRLTGIRTNYYLVLEDKILFPIKRDGKYFIVLIDLEKNKVLWERYINGIDGLFFNLSNCENINGIVHFVLSTTYSEGCGKIYEEGIDICYNAELIYIKSKLLSLDLRRGLIKRILKIPLNQSDLINAFRKITFLKTKNYLIYNLYGKLVKVEKK